MFFHGDLYFAKSPFDNLNFKKSFLLIDNKGMMKNKEIGITIHNNKATMLSYGLPTKWCQIAFITGKELKILNNILIKLQGSQKKLLSFEQNTKEQRKKLVKSNKSCMVKKVTCFLEQKRVFWSPKHDFFRTRIPKWFGKMSPN